MTYGRGYRGEQPSSDGNSFRPFFRRAAWAILNDGQWHTIVCHKTASQVTLTVDGILVGTANVTVGSITFKTNAVFALGYKPVPGGTDADFYNGLMRNVSVSIG